MPSAEKVPVPVRLVAERSPEAIKDPVVWRVEAVKVPLMKESPATSKSLDGEASPTPTKVPSS